MDPRKETPRWIRLEEGTEQVTQSLSAIEKFEWPVDADLPGDVDLAAFEDEYDLKKFNWDLVIWWNMILADASYRGRKEGRDPVELLPQGWRDTLGDRSTPDAVAAADAMVMTVAARVPRSEKRCVNHLAQAVSHVLRAKADVAKSPWMIYEADTGIWRQDGQWLSDRKVGMSVGSAVDEVLDRFEAAMHRAIDTLDSMVELAEPDPGPKPPTGAPAQQRQAWQTATARRKELKQHYEDAYEMARDIPRGKYRLIKNALRERLAIEQIWWDRDTRWLVLRDGVLDLEDVMRNGRMSLYSFSPYLASTMALDVALSDAERNAGKSEWQRGVEKVLPDAEVREYLQKRFGAALLGRPGIAGKSMVWQYGVGDTAKSTIQECIAGARGVFAPYSYTADPMALTKKGAERGATERFIAYARGKRFVVLSELNDAEHLDGAKLKLITGGETVAGTAKYSNEVNYFFTATLFMASNHAPTYPPGDTALVGRIHVVPFTHRLWVKSKNPDEWEAADPEHRADEDWANRVLNSPQERAAIFRWVVDGLVKFGRDGGIGRLPAAMETARQEFSSDADPVGTLVRALLGTEPGYEDSAWLKILSDIEWGDRRESDGIPDKRIEELINMRARDFNLVRFPEDGLSRSYMRAAKRMLHEVGGNKKKVKGPDGRAIFAYSRMVETLPAELAVTQGANEWAARRGNTQQF